MPARVAFRCDCGPLIGVGHVMRCLALADALHERGHAVEFLADVAGLDWVAEALARRGFPVRPGPTEPAALATAVAGCDVVVFDSYLLGSAAYRAVRERGAVTVAFVDGELRGAEADLLVDQNPGAERDDVALPVGTTRLAGLSFAVVRADITGARPAKDALDGVDTRSVLVVLGGTDARGLAPRIVQGLVDTGAPMSVRAIGAREALRAQLRQIHPGAHQQVEVMAPQPDVQRLVLASRVVVGAAGTSALEFLALGACAALVCVADNQARGYRRLVEAGAVTGLGNAAEVDGDWLAPAAGAVVALLDDDAARRRQAGVAWSLVDGRGAARIADAIEQRLRRDPR